MTYSTTGRCAHCDQHTTQYFNRKWHTYPEGAVVTVTHSEDRMSCPASPTGVHVEAPRDEFRYAVLSLAGSLSFDAGQADERARRLAVEGPHDQCEVAATRAAATALREASDRLYAVLSAHPRTKKETS